MQIESLVWEMLEAFIFWPLPNQLYFVKKQSKNIWKDKDCIVCAHESNYFFFSFFFLPSKFERNRLTGVFQALHSLFFLLLGFGSGFVEFNNTS